MQSYRCWSDDDTEDDAITIETYAPEAAAEEWARQSDADGDYPIISGSPAQVIVDDGQVRKTYEVTGESVPTYYAEEAKP